LELWGLTILYSKNKAKKPEKRKLDKFISNPANTDHLTRQWKTEYIMLKDKLCLLYENKAKGAIICSKTKWMEQGKKPKKYFFNLEKKEL